MAQVKISKFLHILLELSNFVKHSEYLLVEIHCQLANVFEFQLITADIHFQVKKLCIIINIFFKTLGTIKYGSMIIDYIFCKLLFSIISIIPAIVSKYSVNGLSINHHHLAPLIIKYFINFFSIS